MIKRLFIVCLCAIFVIQLSSCSISVSNKVEKEKFAMDTVIYLTAYGANASEAIDAAMIRIDEIEQMASASIETSDISQINQAAGTNYVKVHPEVLKMVETAIKYYTLTDGAFDVTIGPLIKLWAIGTDNEKVPSAEQISSALELVGTDKISINENDSSIKLTETGMSIDLGGIAKGFAADEVLKIFKSYGIESALINMGSSSIFTLGQKPDGTLWSVAIQHPRITDSQEYLGIVRMPELALSTSGDYERYFIQDGKRYHHILSPSAGYPADSGVISVTVVVDSSVSDCNMLADILTKATFILGVEKGFEIIDSMPGVACLAVTDDYEIYKSLNWQLAFDDVSKDFVVN